VLRSHAAAFEKPSQAEASRLLVDIWNAAFPMEPLSSGEVGEHWRRLGFQSGNPYSDIRGGRICLEQLHYLAMQYPEKLQKLALEAQDPYYPFACGCFNITQMLAVFFHLHGGPLASPVPGSPAANSRQLEHLITLCEASGARGLAVASGAEPEAVGQTILHELFCSLVEGLHATWMGMNSEGSVTLMDFPRALREVHAAHVGFWSKSATSAGDFDSLRHRLRKTIFAQEGATFLWTSLRSTHGALKDVQAQLLSSLWALLWQTQGQLGDELHEAFIDSRPGQEVQWHRSPGEDEEHPASRYGSYRAPDLPCPSRPCARLAGEIDVDAALQRLGVDVCGAVASTCGASAAPVQSVIDFLDQCLDVGHVGPMQSAMIKEIKEVDVVGATGKATRQPQELYAFLDGCLTATTCTPGVRPIADASACLEGVWDNFGAW